MKKIISLICVVAMLCSMFTVVANADANNYFEWTYEEVTGEPGSIIMNLSMTTEFDITNYAVYYSFADALDKGATVELYGEKGAKVTYTNYVPAQQFAVCNWADIASSAKGTNYLFSVKVSNITESFTVTVQPYSNRTKTYASILDGTEKTDSFTIKDFTYTVQTAPTTYAVTVNGGTADKAEAAEGDTVTVTPTIPSGKVLDTITSADVTLTDNGNGTYSFTMPAKAVTVTVTTKDEVVAPTFTWTAEAQADLYWNNNGSAEAVKVWNCTVANNASNTVKLTFNGTMERSLDLAPIAGEASLAFQTLLFGATGTPTLVISE